MTLSCKIFDRLRFLLWILICFYCIAGCTLNSNEADRKFDILISGGTVVDGTGREPFKADVLIIGDRIVYIGEVDPDSLVIETIVDASGMIVTPGFIDAHSHANPLFDSTSTNSLAMGVTTVIIGQDGRHPTYNPSTRRSMKLGSWRNALQQAGTSLNVALLAGHSSLRSAAGVATNAKPTQGQLTEMINALDSALHQGCFGMSTGLEYVGGNAATDEELLPLAEVVGVHDGIIVSHMRSEDDDAIEEAINELLRQGEHARVQVTHLKSVYGKGAERGKDILSKLEEARASGIPISADSYPYLASYTTIGIIFPDWANTREEFDQVIKSRKSELEMYLRNRVSKRNGPSATLFTSGRYTGLTLAGVAEKEEKTFVQVLMEMGPNAASAAFFVMDQELHDQFTLSPDVMVSSDGGPSLRHPRSYGAFARIIEKYVTAEQLPLETAIYKMTLLPATTFGIRDRGALKKGLYADILVLDPAKVRERGTFENPFQLAEGFNDILINGTWVRKKSVWLENKTGYLLSK